MALLDEDVYLCSIRQMYRLLNDAAWSETAAAATSVLPAIPPRSCTPLHQPGVGTSAAELALRLDQEHPSHCGQQAHDGQHADRDFHQEHRQRSVPGSEPAAGTRRG